MMRFGQRVATVSPVPPRHDLDEEDSYGRWCRKSAVLGRVAELGPAREGIIVVRHDDTSKGRYTAEELLEVREVATTANELTPMEQRLAELERGQGQIASSITGLRYTVARHDEQLRSLSPPEDPDDAPPADVPQGDPLELARSWRDLAAEDQELVHGELLGLPLSDVASLHSQAAADALGAVEPLAAEVESRGRRVLLATRQLGATFERDTGSLEVMASHACARYDACRYELQEQRATAWRLTRQLAELAGEDPDGEHEADDLIEAIEQQMHDDARNQDLLIARVDRQTAEVTRLKPWAQLAQQLWAALQPWQGEHLIGACKALAASPNDAWRALEGFLRSLGQLNLRQLGSLDATAAAAQEAAPEPAEGDE